MAVSDRDVAEYIASLLADLKVLAAKHERLRTLARLIEIAEGEAATVGSGPVH